jgi:hypothetical protein
MITSKRIDILLYDIRLSLLFNYGKIFLMIIFFMISFIKNQKSAADKFNTILSINITIFNQHDLIIL